MSYTRIENPTTIILEPTTLQNVTASIPAPHNMSAKKTKTMLSKFPADTTTGPHIPIGKKCQQLLAINIILNKPKSIWIQKSQCKTFKRSRKLTIREALNNKPLVATRAIAPAVFMSGGRAKVSMS